MHVTYLKKQKDRIVYSLVHKFRLIHELVDELVHEP